MGGAIGGVLLILLLILCAVILIVFQKRRKKHYLSGIELLGLHIDLATSYDLSHLLAENTLVVYYSELLICSHENR